MSDYFNLCIHLKAHSVDLFCVETVPNCNMSVTECTQPVSVKQAIDKESGSHSFLFMHCGLTLYGLCLSNKVTACKAL